MPVIATGAQEMTRFAMAPDAACAFAEIIHDDDSRAKYHWREQVAALKRRF